MLSDALLTRLRERAQDPMRRSGNSGITAGAVDLGTLLGSFGPAGANLQGVQSRMQGIMGEFADLMKGFGVAAPMPVGDRASARKEEVLPSPASEAELLDAEQALGRALPDELRRLYAEIASGGFGPSDGLFPLDRLVDEYGEMTSEPAGPQNQPWPAKLLPLVDWQPGYDCLDLETGEVVCWDPEEIEGYGNAAWLRSFKTIAPNLAAWLEDWLDQPTAAERMQQTRERVCRNPMETHVNNLIESYSRLSAEERAAHGLSATGWEDELRRRHGLI